MNKQYVEHSGIRALIDQLEAMHPDDDLYGTIIRGEPTEHQVMDDESEKCPLARMVKVDTSSLAAYLYKRNNALMAELALADERQDDIVASNSQINMAKARHR